MQLGEEDIFEFAELDAVLGTKALPRQEGRSLRQGIKCVGSGMLWTCKVTQPKPRYLETVASIEQVPSTLGNDKYRGAAIPGISPKDLYPRV